MMEKETDLMDGYIPPEEDKIIYTYYEDMEQYEENYIS